MFDKWFELAEQSYSETDAEWDAFVASHPHGSLLQTTAWARLKNNFGWSSQRVWLRHEGKLVAGAQILFKSVAFGVARIGYIPHGPLATWQDEAQTAVLMNQIDLAAYERNAGFVKLEPLLWQDEIETAQWQAICQRYALQPADTIQPPRTAVLDLRPSLDDILASMKQKTRYNIRLAEKKDVTVRQGSMDDLPIFSQLMAVTGERDGFGVHTPQYYKRAYEVFAPEDVALLIAEYEKRPLSAVMAFKNGPRAAYLYGASGNDERNRMPNYAVQWAAVQWAKAQGCTTYDLWGIPDATPDELEAQFTERSDGLWGVYRFKRGFGGDIKRTVGAVDRIYNQLTYKLYQWRRNR
ncbi:MAG: peptidoglycan bridge formation glycyltransferase FemA/FemB family protein [Chloroflexota bacterium]|nr:peptidoglycan bridge formation glycyltransferase FemA/FemB family protein [Anaerolineales bacterium]MCB8965316.1 peptidoglycan bridge formation glycyltransferase FemA/FemB family protein [Ardenticatenaceae bacterium]